LPKKEAMTQVSRPMQILLLATVLFALVWFVALRPKPSGEGGGAAAPAPAAAPTAPGVKGLATAIAKAHGAVATANGDAARAVGSSADAAARAVPAHGASGAVARRVQGRARGHDRVAARHASRHAAARDVALVQRALHAHRAIALAFVDPAAADSRAVVTELAHVGSFGGRALTLAVPLARLSAFGALTRAVQVTAAPTVVIVAPNGEATTIVGFADRVELEQRLADALTQQR
jgi:hypothetical protein